MSLDEAAEDLERLLSGEDGVASVCAGRGCIMVRVNNGRAAQDVRSSYGGAYSGYPIVLQKGAPATAGILTLYPDA